ncbi:MAG: aminomethyl-transferring glycine dehydrogenase subunit GcvPA [Holophagales bacterium]|jgi:glycine dehydrogenase subunit 1|nr:aminomethyl-transferring glycine dehydrogenase subunit GcvPA [Holophagales bacterium]
MRYLPLAPAENQALLDVIGVKSPEDLLCGIPEPLRLKKPLNLPQSSSELDVLRQLEEMAGQNTKFSSRFLGAGAYAHFVPSAIDMLTSRQEWFTAYTPYQPEISQGTLQHIFEYQTLICDLTGLDVSNASMYDGGTACVEAALLAVRVQKKKNTILVSSGLHPHYQEVISTNIAPHDGLKLVRVELKDGVTDLEDLKAKLTQDVACFLAGYPNFLGCIEDTAAISAVTKPAGALLVSVTQESMSLGWLEAPGKSGADMACGEAMSFGNSTSFGGPFLGYLAVKDGHKREMPGRIVGQTQDLNGKRGFVLTLASREQHIRRDKATSNICSNQALVALRANIFLQLAGPEGLKGLAMQNAAKAQYLQSKLIETGKFETVFAAPYFNEFVLRYKGSANVLHEACLARGILPGLLLDQYYKSLADCMLWCATELNTKQEIDELAAFVASMKA